MKVRRRACKALIDTDPKRRATVCGKRAMHLVTERAMPVCQECLDNMYLGGRLSFDLGSSILSIGTAAKIDVYRP